MLSTSDCQLIFPPCLKYIEQNHSFDSLTLGSASFDICFAFGNYDITTFRQYVSFSELSLPQHISRFWRKICSLNQLSSFFLIFLRMEMSPYKKNINHQNLSQSEKVRDETEENP